MKSSASTSSGCAAGVFTSPILLPLTAHLLESFGALDNLEAFTSGNGRAFYGLPVPDEEVTLRKTEATVVDSQYQRGGQSVVPFMAGKKINWEIASAV